MVKIPVTPCIAKKSEYRDLIYNANEIALAKAIFIRMTPNFTFSEYRLFCSISMNTENSIYIIFFPMLRWPSGYDVWRSVITDLSPLCRVHANHMAKLPVTCHRFVAFPPYTPVFPPPHKNWHRS